MNYETEPGLPDFKQFFNIKQQPNNMENLPTDLPQNFGEILAGVDPRVARYALLGTALTLKAAYYAARKSRSLFQKAKGFLSRKDKWTMLDAPSHPLYMWGSPQANVPNPFLEGMGDFQPLGEGVKMTEAKAEESDGPKKFGRFQTIEADGETKELTPEQVQAIEKMVVDNDPIRAKYVNGLMGPPGGLAAPLLSDKDAQFLNEVARKLGQYMDGPYKFSQRPRNGVGKVIDGLRFLPAEEIEKMRQLVGEDKSKYEPLGDIYNSQRLGFADADAFEGYEPLGDIYNSQRLGSFEQEAGSDPEPPSQLGFLKND